jgi:hypothetical protein
MIRTDAGGFFGFGESPLPQAASLSGRFAQLLPPLPPTPEQRKWARAALKVLGFAPPS